MKKLTLNIAAATLLLTAAGNVQAQDHNGFIGIGVGATLPTGDFANNDFDVTNAGFAKTGVLFDLQLGYKFTDVVGAMVLARTQGHQFDEEAYADRSGVAGPTVPVTVEADPWATLGVMAGPFVSFPFTDENRIAFEARALAGYSRTRRPEITSSTSGSREREESVEASSLGWLVGTGIRFNLTSRFGMGIHVDYYSANPEFEVITTNSAGVPAATRTYEQSVSLVNASLSLGYRFL